MEGRGPRDRRRLRKGPGEPLDGPAVRSGGACSEDLPARVGPMGEGPVGVAGTGGAETSALRAGSPGSGGRPEEAGGGSTWDPGTAGSGAARATPLPFSPALVGPADLSRTYLMFGS